MFGGVTIPGTTHLNAAAFFNGPILNKALFDGNVGIGYASSINRFCVDAISRFDGRINATGGQLLAEGGFQSLGDYRSKNDGARPAPKGARYDERLGKTFPGNRNRTR